MDKKQFKRTGEYNNLQIDQDFLTNDCKKFLKNEVSDYMGHKFDSTRFVADILKNDDKKLVKFLLHLFEIHLILTSASGKIPRNCSEGERSRQSGFNNTL